MSSPVLVLRDGIRSLLRANAGFQGIAAKRIYDEVPADLKGVVTPYAYFGPMRRTRLDLACDEGGDGPRAWTMQARLYAVSTGFDRTQGWSLVEAMSDALDMVEADRMPLATPYVLQKPIEVTQAGDVIDPLQAKSVFLDLTTIIARGTPDEEP